MKSGCMLKWVCICNNLCLSNRASMINDCRALALAGDDKTPICYGEKRRRDHVRASLKEQV
eukprot:3635176-Pleurochrysis_carterae.AAC.1